MASKQRTLSKEWGLDANTMMWCGLRARSAEVVLLHSSKRSVTTRWMSPAWSCVSGLTNECLAANAHMAKSSRNGWPQQEGATREQQGSNRSGWPQHEGATRQQQGSNRNGWPR